MNLSGLETRTAVEFDPALAEDEFTLQGIPESGAAAGRVSAHLNVLRARAGVDWKARVSSSNSFPAAAGIASSAAAFAALTVAGAAALGMQLPERVLSAIARRGSGSACRSIPAGFTEWKPADRDEDCYAVSIAPPDYWALVDLIAIVSTEPKATPSVEGHALASTSPFQSVRTADTPRRLTACRGALRDRDFAALAEILEEDARMMHAVMLTSRPALVYLAPETVALMRAIPAWRAEGLAAAYTIDAGPNVHCITDASCAEEVNRRLEGFPGVQRVLYAEPGGAARLIEE